MHDDPASAKSDHPPGLELDQQLRLQRLGWLVQRVGWVVMLLVIVGGLAGVFGSGPLARATAGSRGAPLWIEYDRFLRHQAPTIVRVHVGAAGRDRDTARVWLDRALLEGFRVQQVTPHPARVEAGADRLLYVFHGADRGAGITVRFDLEPERLGLRRGRIGLPEGPTLSVTQLVYP